MYKDGYYNDSKYFSNLIPATDIENYEHDSIFENLSQIKHNLILLSESCRINGIKLIVATCCSISSKRQLLMMNNVIRELAADCQYDLLDLDLMVERSEKYFYDKQHLNLRGSKMFGQLLFQFLRNKVPRNGVLNFSKKTLIADRMYQQPFEIDLTVPNLKSFYGGFFIEIDHQEEFTNDGAYYSFDVVIELYGEDLLGVEYFSFQDVFGSKVEKSSFLAERYVNVSRVVIKFPAEIKLNNFFIRYMKFYYFYL